MRVIIQGNRVVVWRHCAPYTRAYVVPNLPALIVRLRALQFDCSAFANTMVFQR